MRAAAIGTGLVGAALPHLAAMVQGNLPGMAAVGSAVVGAAAAIIVLGAIGGLTYRLVARIPRRALQLFVGAMLTTFGTFWAGEGLGVAWPGDQSALLALGVVYVLAALALLRWARPRTTSAPSLAGRHR